MKRKLKKLPKISELLKGKNFFIALAASFLIFMVIVVIYNFVFLATNINKALSREVKAKADITFDIDTFKKLNLVK